MLPFELTKDTPYLALSGELWSVFYEYFNRNWSCYKGFLLYHHKAAHEYTTSRRQGGVAVYIRPKYILISNIAKSRLSRTLISVVKSFWNFAQRTAVTLPCAVKNFKTIWQLSEKLWANTFSPDFSSRCVSDGYLRCFRVPNFNDVPNLRDMTVIQWQNMPYTGLWLPFSQCVIVILRTSSDKHGSKNTWIRISIQIDQSVWVKIGYINI